jgi:hypothetical protein
MTRHSQIIRNGRFSEQPDAVAKAVTGYLQTLTSMLP